MFSLLANVTFYFLNIIWTNFMSLQSVLFSNSEILLKILTSWNSPNQFFQYRGLNCFFFSIQNLNCWKLSFKGNVNTLEIKTNRMKKKGQQSDKYKITNMDPDARVYFNSKWLSAGDTYRGKKIPVSCVLVTSCMTILSVLITPWNYGTGLWYHKNPFSSHVLEIWRISFILHLRKHKFWKDITFNLI